MRRWILAAACTVILAAGCAASAPDEVPSSPASGGASSSAPAGPSSPADTPMSTPEDVLPVTKAPLADFTQFSFPAEAAGLQLVSSPRGEDGLQRVAYRGGGEAINVTVQPKAPALVVEQIVSVPDPVSTTNGACGAHGTTGIRGCYQLLVGGQLVTETSNVSDQRVAEFAAALYAQLPVAADQPAWPTPRPTTATAPTQRDLADVTTAFPPARVGEWARTDEIVSGDTKICQYSIAGEDRTIAVNVQPASLAEVEELVSGVQEATAVTHGSCGYVPSMGGDGCFQLLEGGLVRIQGPRDRDFDLVDFANRLYASFA